MHVYFVDFTMMMNSTVYMDDIKLLAPIDVVIND